MLNFTKQEKLVLVFLGFAALVGLAANLFMKKSLPAGRQGCQLNNFYPAAPPVESYTKTDINKATVQQLQDLPGIGPVLSQRIIDFRQQNGPFKRLEELQSVKGISVRLYQKIKGRLFISP